MRLPRIEVPYGIQQGGVIRRATEGCGASTTNPAVTGRMTEIFFLPEGEKLKALEAKA